MVKAEKKANEIRKNTLDFLSDKPALHNFLMLFEPINRYHYDDLASMPKATLTISIGKSHNADCFEAYLTATSERPSIMWWKDNAIAFSSHFVDHKELITSISLTDIASISIDDNSINDYANYLITVKTNRFDYLIRFGYNKE